MDGPSRQVAKVPDFKVVEHRHGPFVELSRAGRNGDYIVSYDPEDGVGWAILAASGRAFLCERRDVDASTDEMNDAEQVARQAYEEWAIEHGPDAGDAR